MTIPPPQYGGPPIHPGESLKDDLDALGLSMNKFSAAIGVPTNRIAEIVRGRRAITADTALRLAAFFGTTAEFWLGLQTAYDLRKAEIEHGEEIKATVKPCKQAA